MAVPYQLSDGTGGLGPGPAGDTATVSPGGSVKPDPRSPAFALYSADTALLDGLSLPRLKDRIDPPERLLWPLLYNPTPANLRTFAAAIAFPPARFLDPWMGVMVPCVQNILGWLIST